MRYAFHLVLVHNNGGYGFDPFPPVIAFEP
jgi:hypothetical protein